MATNNARNRPGGINARAKGKRTDSGLNPGSFAAYLADAPDTASFAEITEAWREGVCAADLHDYLGGGK